MARRGTGALLRSRGGHGHARVTNIELFFDLVFVFGVTQLSHALLRDLTLAGALRTLLIFLPVWWVWIYTSWVTNWLDPERVPVRLLLVALMLAGLVLSSSIPEAFGEKGLAFALAYVAMQVGRSFFMVLALGSTQPGNRRNFQRITIWFVVSGLFWIAGGLAEGETRLALWIIGLGLDVVAPAAGFVVPGLGRSTTDDWDVEGGHLAERCSLFIIIALGESVLVTGATFAEAPLGVAEVAAFAAAFIGSAAMWWVYFDTGAERGVEHITGSADPGRLARLLYTYVHLIIVAGIIVSAVGDELLLAHPSGHAEPGFLWTALGGPALYLAGNGLFKWPFNKVFPLSHLVGLGLLALLAAFGRHWEPLSVGIGAAIAMVVVAGWETRALRLNRPGQPGR